MPPRPCSGRNSAASPGKVGDATILSLEDGSFPLEDVVGEIVTAERRITAKGAVIGGRFWHPTDWPEAN
jgi:dihydroorotase